MQDALFQSRIATSNLLKLQKQLERFREADYLKELKIENNKNDQQSTTTKSNTLDIQNNDVDTLQDSTNNVTLAVPL